jgi:chemotaxis protein MotA
MLAIIGLLVVILAVAGGYAFTKGPFSVLFQPAELIIIIGAAAGIILLGTSPKVLRQLMSALPKVFKGSPYTKASYLELLKLQYEVFSKIRKGGLIAMEEEVDNPYEGAIFKNYPGFIKNRHAVHFFCDSMRLIISGTDVGEVEHIMQTDLATLHEESQLPAGMLQKVGDAMPGLGIVAAVLGIIVTMQKLDGPPEELGQHVAAALVGTFLGILVSYGFFQPLASAIEGLGRDEHKYLQCIMVGLTSSTGGTSPVTAVEQARRVIFDADRPTTQELEAAINQIKENKASSPTP